MDQKGISSIIIILIIVGVLATAGGIYWWQKDIIDYSIFIFHKTQLNKAVKCYQTSDCELVYTGVAGCSSCDLSDPDYKCVSPEQAKVIRNEWLKITEGSSCEKCLPEKSNFNFECTCNSGICEKTEKKIDTFDWQTYRNEKYGFTFKYPSFWTFEENSVFDPRTSKKLFVRYISKEQIEKQNSAPTINYCNAYPEDPKCKIVKEIIKVAGDNTANIDYYKSASKNIAHVAIWSPDGGMVELYITDFVATEKVIVLQILSTFKFIK